MKGVLVLLLLLSVAFGALSLTPREQEGLQAILEAFPVLTAATPPWSSNISEACNSPGFYGITCTSDLDAHVLKLEFNISKLLGVVPEAISKLTWLEFLSITDGCLSHAIPATIDELQKLKVLILSDALTGCDQVERNVSVLVPSIVNLANLNTLSISLKLLSGTLPSEISNLRNLEHLRLSGSPWSELRGTIASSFSKLDRLRTLYITSTQIDKIEDFRQPVADPFPHLEELSFRDSLKLTGDGRSFVTHYSSKYRIIDFSSTRLDRDSLSYIYGNPSLTFVDVSNSPVALILNRLWNLRNLTEVRAISSGAFGSLPNDFSHLTRLKTLQLGGLHVWGVISSSIVSCPLEILELSETIISHPIPDNIGLLNATLRSLVLNNLNGGPNTIPASIGNLEKLVYLDLSSARFNGSIPASFANLKRAGSINLNNNALQYTLPPIYGDGPLFFSAANNRLVGSIPRSIASRVVSLQLGNNFLDGEIEYDLFSSNRNLKTLDLSHNRFNGSLPTLTTPSNLDLSYNGFKDAIPTSYCNLTGVVTLSHNRLSGSLANILSPKCQYVSFSIDHNSFSGTVPWLDEHLTLVHLDLSHNNLSGTLPRLPVHLNSFIASNNCFSSAQMAQWAVTLRLTAVNVLDLSANGITTSTPFYELIGPKMTSLILSRNHFAADSSISVPVVQPNLLGLDLSYNGLTTFKCEYYPNLIVLNLAHNSLSGSPHLDKLPALTQVDISNNFFTSDLALFFKNLSPLITKINARRNNFFGVLTLDSKLTNLQAIDFSANDLLYAPNFASIGALFADAQLQQLNISANDKISLVTSFDTALTGLNRTSLSSPSQNRLYRNTLTCYELSFWNKTGISFIFDEPLFDYRQCDCNEKHFGLPPEQCFICPTSGISSCGADSVKVYENHFAFMSHVLVNTAPSSNVKHSSRFEIGLRLLTNAFWSYFSNSRASIGDGDAQNDLSRYNALGTESCLYTAIQNLNEKSNCLGIQITAENLKRSGIPLTEMLKLQCSIGSEGRLCSKCLCNTEGKGDCWFERSGVCKKCRHVFSLSSSILLLVSALVLIILVLSGIMVIVLKRRRKQRLDSFDQLPLHHRLFYRLLYLVTLGNVTILINFLQMLIAFTQWDAFVRLEVFGAINGDTTGLGLQCLFPFLSEPMWELIVHLCIPFVAVGIIGISVVISSSVVRLLEKRKEHLTTLAETAPVISKSSREVDIEYPALALFTSMSITVVKFFFFGTALSAHQYLFSSFHTGTYYVQNKPWMLYINALPLIAVSAPSIILFDLILPSLFIFVCWKVHQNFSTRSVQIYFGSLFETYNPACFWWEIVNILRKLSVALVLRGIPASDAFQSALIVSILAGIQVIQLTVNPWRRKTENFCDGISALLLIGALLATRPTQLSHTVDVTIIMLILSCIFVAANILIIVIPTIRGTTEYEKQLKRYLGSLELKTQSEDHYEDNGMDDWSMSSDTEATPLLTNSNVASTSVQHQEE